MGSTLRIVNGRVYDPANDVDGKTRDICIKDGKIVKSVPPKTKCIDAKGMVVMPGGVDIHCHIAGAKANIARKLQPDDHRRDVHHRLDLKKVNTRSGTGGTVPSTFTTGYRYATMGYTTAMEAAVPPLLARHTLDEFDDTPVIDKGFYILMGNNVLLYQMLQEGRHEEIRNAVAWWLNATKSYTTKLVNPGGDEPWKGHRNATITQLNDKIDGYEQLTPRKIITSMVNTVEDLGLPHPVHIHCNNLGHSGNYKTTLETMKATGGRRIHITHIQFHSYGGKPNENPTSKAPQIAEYINNNPNITADVGQVMFGRSTSMTADAPLAWMLTRYSNDRRWVNADTECESGCGIIPFAYQEQVYTHALQWAIGLELFLLSKDPWRMVLSTDHPNGGTFTSYPRLIRTLMDREFRKQQMDSVNQKAVAKIKRGHHMEREYTLQEIAIVTRAGPARILGLKNKGHLGPGADADITIYDEHEDKELMFSAPRYVLKSGHLIIDNHEFRNNHEGKILHVAPGYDEGIKDVIRPFVEDFYTIKFDNYAVSDHYIPRHEVVPTAKQ